MHGGNVELLAPRYGFKINEIIDFSANINPYGPPSDFRKILQDSADEISRYPDPHSTALRTAIAQYHKVQVQNIVVGNGASELIFWIPRLFESAKAVILAPAFSEYDKAVKSSGGRVQYVIAKEQDNFHHYFENLRFNGDADTNLIFISNPNNPTGNIYSKTALEDWIWKYSKKMPQSLFIIDESFISFLPDEQKYSLVSIVEKCPQLIILRSLTKILSIPGLRLGYAIADSSIAQKLESLMPTWRINIFAQRFGERILQYASFIQQSAKKIELNRQILINDLRTIPNLVVYDSYANLILLKIEEQWMRAEELTEQCARRGYLVRCCDDFVGLEKDRFIRVAVRKPEENKALVKVLKDLRFNVR